MKALVSGCLIAALWLANCHAEMAEANATAGHGSPNPAHNLPRMRPRREVDQYGSGAQAARRRQYVETFDEEDEVDFEYERQHHRRAQPQMDMDAARPRRRQQLQGHRTGRPHHRRDTFEEEEQDYGHGREGPRRHAAPADGYYEAEAGGRPQRLHRRRPVAEDYESESEVPRRGRVARRREGREEAGGRLAAREHNVEPRARRRGDRLRSEEHYAEGQRVERTRRPRARRARPVPVTAKEDAEIRVDGLPAPGRRRRRRAPRSKREEADAAEREQEIMAEAMRLLEHSPSPFGAGEEGANQRDKSPDVQAPTRPDQGRPRRLHRRALGRSQRNQAASIPKENEPAENDGDWVSMEGQSEDSLLIPMPEWMLYANRIEEDASSRDFVYTIPDKVVKTHPMPGSTVENPELIQKRCLLRPPAYS